MKTDHYCNRSDEMCHHCHNCNYCYCADVWMGDEYEPSDDEFEAMIEKERALSEAIYENRRH